MTKKEFIHKLVFEMTTKHGFGANAAVVGSAKNLADELAAVEPFDEESPTALEIISGLMEGPLGAIIATATGGTPPLEPCPEEPPVTEAPVDPATP